MSKKEIADKLFSNEAKVLQEYRTLLSNENGEKVNRSALEELVKRYSSLLEQSRFLTWISGRLERKLQKANQELFVKNHDMQKALDDLVKAKAGKKAYAIIYFIAIILFVLEEFFVEPLIVAVGGGSLWYSILFKLVIVLLLKSSEGVIEDLIISKAPLRKLNGKVILQEKLKAQLDDSK